MIQRIQSLYLLIGAIALLAIFFLDYPWDTQAAEAYGAYGPALIVGTLATAGVAIGAIFLYNNRPRQVTVVVAAQGLTFLTALLLYGPLFLTGELTVRVDGALAWGRIAALTLPAVAYVLFLLARRAIKADIELVKSMDRLR